jgi:putative FmdB family regulatory protein
MSASVRDRTAYAPRSQFVPTYAYVCTECGHNFETVQAIADAALTTCPQCSGRLRKVFHPVGVAFKGSGFYQTDSRKAAKADSDASKAAAAKSESPASDGASTQNASSGDGSKSTDSSTSSDSSKSKSQSAKPGASTPAKNNT